MQPGGWQWGTADGVLQFSIPNRVDYAPWPRFRARPPSMVNVDPVQ